MEDLGIRKRLLLPDLRPSGTGGAGVEEEKTNAKREIPEIKILDVNTCVWLVGKESSPGKLGAWGLPGGKVQSTDSTLIDTAVREVLEETGLEINDQVHIIEVVDRSQWSPETECFRIDSV